MVDDAVKKVYINIHMFKVQHQIWTPYCDYLLALKVAEYGNLTQCKPHIATTLIVARLKQNHLKFVWKIATIQWQKIKILIRTISINLCNRRRRKPKNCIASWKFWSVQERKSLAECHQKKKNSDREERQNKETKQYGEG